VAFSLVCGAVSMLFHNLRREDRDNALCATGVRGRWAVAAPPAPPAVPAQQEVMGTMTRQQCALSIALGLIMALQGPHSRCSSSR
jgi:hypothetical protein